MPIPQNHLATLAVSIKKNLLKKYFIIPSLFFFMLTYTILYFNQAHKCTASDFDTPVAVEKTFTGYSFGEACRKALAVCSFYTESKNCKIKNLNNETVANTNSK